MQRTQWGSRLGFILASAGATVGLGSVWKFPYVTAMNGGGVFLLVYLAFTFTLGLALLQAELAIGRAAGCGAVGAFSRLGSRRWKLLGYSGVLCCFLVFAFYSVVGGWTLGYLLRALDGRVMSDDMSALGQLFGQYVGNPAEALLTHALFAGLTLLVVVGGVQQGIERAGKVLMPLLFLLMLGLIARALTLPGALAGAEALFRPDFSRLTPAMLVEALGLACFSLSVGAGCMLAYGSYLGQDTRLGNSALWVTGLTALTSVLAGLMIFPAIYAFGLDPQAGPGLTYMVMPVVFNHLPYGQLFAIVFFILLLMAALTSAVSLLEVVVILPIDEFGVSRRKATLAVTALVFLAGVPAALSFGPLGDCKLFGRNIFELMDYAACNILLPLGCIGTALFAGRVAWPAVSDQLRLSAWAEAWMRLSCRWLAPLLIGVVLVYNL
ncbi:sodium-dependent transporter [Chromobacterium phragmitis]|uniref:sodium-dependent transporter n=2 Tax=Chromobacterium amazonense TaxID=1382803 RepID=UPI0021B82154|nr:sodium-dependent transporter [Chromobacterium amazonense]MBM2886047.1 sodium-dependent transporter [Chromobacterium amazonense]